MKTKPLLLAMVAAVLLVALAAEVEAGVSFHPRPKEKSSNRSGNAPKPSSKRQVYDDVTLQMEEGHSNSAAAQVEVPSQLGLTKSKVDSEQLGELLMQVLSSLLGSDGQES
ncbi:uncharacterized protein LOC144677079 isoform X2 [Cetorhinus maximus]